MTEQKKDERKLITVRVSDELHRELRLLAADQDESLGELCAAALKEWRSLQSKRVVVVNEEANRQELPRPVKPDSAPKDGVRDAEPQAKT